MGELLKVQDTYNKQQMILLNLQDNNNNLLEGLRLKDEEIIKLKQSLNEKQQHLNKAKIEIKKHQQLSRKLMENVKANAELVTIKAQYEKKFEDLSKNLSFYKDAAE